MVTRDVHEWLVRIDGRSINVWVGISQENINPVDQNGDISCMLGCYDGYVCAFGKWDKYMDVPVGGLPAGSLVSVRLDLDKRTLTFGLNGEWHDKPALTDIEPNTWYPFVQLWNSESGITVVHPSSYRELLNLWASHHIIIIDNR
jgi:hypothetical protein